MEKALDQATVAGLGTEGCSLAKDRSKVRRHLHQAMAWKNVTDLENAMEEVVDIDFEDGRIVPARDRVVDLKREAKARVALRRARETEDVGEMREAPAHSASAGLMQRNLEYVRVWVEEVQQVLQQATKRRPQPAPGQPLAALPFCKGLGYGQAGGTGPGAATAGLDANRPPCERADLGRGNSVPAHWPPWPWPTVAEEEEGETGSKQAAWPASGPVAWPASGPASDSLGAAGVAAVPS